MSSSGPGTRVVGGREGKKGVVSTRAQTRGDRTKMNLNVISPRSTTGPREISPRGGSDVEISSTTARKKLRARSYSPTLGIPVTSPTARTAPISVACADDIPTPPPMVLSRLKSNPYAGRSAHIRKGMVESATAVPISRAPPTHTASDSEILIALKDAVSSQRIACGDPHP